MDRITSTNLKIQSKYSSSSTSKSIFYSPHMHVLPLLYIQCYHWIEHAGYRYKYKYWLVPCCWRFESCLIQMSSFLYFVLWYSSRLCYCFFSLTFALRPLHCIYWKLFRFGSGWMNESIRTDHYHDHAMTTIMNQGTIPNLPAYPSDKWRSAHPTIHVLHLHLYLQRCMLMARCSTVIAYRFEFHCIVLQSIRQGTTVSFWGQR